MLSPVAPAHLVRPALAPVAEVQVPPAGGTIRLPAPSGPFRVGERSYDLVDESRPDPFSSDPASRRELMVSVFYPAGRVPPGTPRAPYVPNAQVFAQPYGDGPQGVDEFRRIFEGIRTDAFLDARLAPRARALPVVIFMPGRNMVPQFFTSLEEDLASRGYLVAAINPTGISAVTMFSDGRVVGSEVPPVDSTTPQGSAQLAKETDIEAADEKFVLKELSQMNAGLIPSPFRGRLDLGHAAAVGHSLGGATAAQLVATDPQFRTGVDLDGTLWGPTQQTGVGRPFLFLMKSAPTSKELRHLGITRAEYQRQYDKSQPDTAAIAATIRAGGARVLFNGFAHISFSDLELIPGLADSGPTNADGPSGVRAVRAVETFVAAFLRAKLLGGRSPLFNRHISPYRGVYFSTPSVS
jgi:dienelactone hydrolase